MKKGTISLSEEQAKTIRDQLNELFAYKKMEIKDFTEKAKVYPNNTCWTEKIQEAERELKSITETAATITRKIIKAI